MLINLSSNPGIGGSVSYLLLCQNRIGPIGSSGGFGDAYAADGRCQPSQTVMLDTLGLGYSGQVDEAPGVKRLHGL